MIGWMAEKMKPSRSPTVQLAHSTTELAMLIGARTVEVVMVNGARVTVAYSADADMRAPVNRWATAVLGREVRGEVVALIVK